MKKTHLIIALLFGSWLTMAIASSPTKSVLWIDGKGACRLEIACDPMVLLLGKSFAQVPEGEKQKLAEATPTEIAFRVERIKEILLSQTVVKTDRGPVPLQITEFPQLAANESLFRALETNTSSPIVLITLNGQLPVDTSSIWVQFPRFLGTVTLDESQPLHSIGPQRIVAGETSTVFPLPRGGVLPNPSTPRLWAILLSSSLGLAALWVLRTRISALFALINDHRRNRRLRTSH